MDFARVNVARFLAFSTLTEFSKSFPVLSQIEPRHCAFRSASCSLHVDRIATVRGNFVKPSLRFRFKLHPHLCYKPARYLRFIGYICFILVREAHSCVYCLSSLRGIRSHSRLSEIHVCQGERELLYMINLITYASMNPYRSEFYFLPLFRVSFSSRLREKIRQPAREGCFNSKRFLCTPVFAFLVFFFSYTDVCLATLVPQPLQYIVFPRSFFSLIYKRVTLMDRHVRVQSS